MSSTHRVARELKNMAKPPWLAGTPALPFESVFPGITNECETDVIENENLNRKYRQNRWLQSPLATKIEDCTDKANNCGKDADATWQTKVDPQKCQKRQKLSLPMHRLRGRSKSLTPAQKDSVTRLSRVKQPVGPRIHAPSTSSPSPRLATTNPRINQDSMDEIETDVIEKENLHRKCRQNRWLKSFLVRTLATDKANDATRQKKVKPANGQTSQRQNPRKRQNRQIIEDCTDKANNCGKDADATQVNPRKCQNRQKSSLPMHRLRGRSKSLTPAQQDSVTRLSRVKQPLGPRIIIHTPRSAPTSTRVNQDPMAMSFHSELRFMVKSFHRDSTYMQKIPSTSTGFRGHVVGQAFAKVDAVKRTSVYRSQRIQSKLNRTTPSINSPSPRGATTTPRTSCHRELRSMLQSFHESFHRELQCIQKTTSTSTGFRGHVVGQAFAKVDAVKSPNQSPR